MGRGCWLLGPCPHRCGLRSLAWQGRRQRRPPHGQWWERGLDRLQAWGRTLKGHVMPQGMLLCGRGDSYGRQAGIEAMRGCLWAATVGCLGPAQAAERCLGVMAWTGWSPANTHARPPVVVAVPLSRRLASPEMGRRPAERLLGRRRVSYTPPAVPVHFMCCGANRCGVVCQGSGRVGGDTHLGCESPGVL